MKEADFQMIKCNVHTTKSQSKMKYMFLSINIDKNNYPENFKALNNQ
jgi:hypothetical protein